MESGSFVFVNNQLVLYKQTFAGSELRNSNVKIVAVKTSALIFNYSRLTHFPSVTTLEPRMFSLLELLI